MPPGAVENAEKLGRSAHARSAVSRYNRLSFCITRNFGGNAMMNNTQEAGPDAARREIEHIAYLLMQLPAWRDRTWIAPTGEAALRQHYAERQKALTERMRQESGMAANFAPAAPAVPPLPDGFVPTSPSAPPLRPSAESPARVFFQENGLKIVFALATLLTLAALRSLLQWDWAGALLARLLPVIPLLLTGLFWRFGEKTRQENRWAAFAFHGMACVLLTFDLLTVNRYWLSEAAPLRLLLAVSLGAGTLAAGGLLRRYRETAYFHLFQSGLLLTLYAILQNCRLLKTDFWPRPILLFGGAYLALAACYLAFALRAGRAETNAPLNAESDAINAEARAQWLHASALIAAVLAALGSFGFGSGSVIDGNVGFGFGFDGVGNGNAWAILMAAAGVIYAAAAQGLNRANLAYVSGFCAGAGAAFALSTHSLLTGTAAGASLLVLCGAALGLSLLNSRRGAESAELSQAWRHVSLTGLLLATGAAWTSAMAAVPLSYQADGLPAAALAAACAGVFLLFAARERRAEYLHGASLNGAVSVMCAALTLRLPAPSLHLALAVYGAAWCGLYLLAARKTRESVCSTAAALSLTLAGAAAVSVLNPHGDEYALLELLPLWAVLFAPGIFFRRIAERERLYGRPFRQCGAFFSGLTLLLFFLLEIGARWSGGAVAQGAFTLTLLCYGAMYGLVTWFRQTPKMVFACAATLTGAYIHSLLARTDLPHLPGAISWPHFAFLAIQAGAFWLAAGWNVRRRFNRPELAAPLLLLAGMVALGAAWIALVHVQTPNEGRWTILTLAWGGAVWFGLWMLETGEICLHAGAWNLLIAWMLLVYDRYGANRDALDIHLLPIAAYLLALGFREGRRQHLDRAQGFWVTGWLLLLTPPFLAYWQGGAAWHTPLFLIECVLAVTLGAAWRIRAFFGCGLLFASLFAAGHFVGRLPEAWGTFAALLLGVGLFAAGFYALTHREMVQRWTMALEARWKAWR